MCYYEERRKNYVWKKKRGGKRGSTKPWYMDVRQHLLSFLIVLVPHTWGLFHRSKRSPFWIKSWNYTDRGSRLKSTNSFSSVHYRKKKKHFSFGAHACFEWDKDYLSDINSTFLLDEHVRRPVPFIIHLYGSSRFDKSHLFKNLSKCSVCPSFFLISEKSRPWKHLISPKVNS